MPGRAGWLRPGRLSQIGRSRCPVGVIVLRALMVLVGVSLVGGGMGLTMIGVFAFIGVPLLIVGLGLISAGASPRP